MFCDPDIFPDDQPPAGSGKVAVGIHQQHASKVTGDQIRRLENFIGSSAIGALGEVGLDWAEPQDTWLLK